MWPGSVNRGNVRRKVSSLAPWISLLLVAGPLGLVAWRCNRNTSRITNKPDQSTATSTDKQETLIFDGRKITWQEFVESGGRCATPALSQVDTHDKRKGLKEFQTSEKNLEQTKKIRVVFHVISKGDDPGEGNVPDQQLIDQVRILNDKFGVNTPFQFELDQKIDRITNPYWYQMHQHSNEESEAMHDRGVKESDVLNIYTAEVPDTLGWAVYPWDAAPEPHYRDGVVIRFSTLPGGTQLYYEDGMTLVHEVAHFLGLLHTYEYGCFPPGDRVDDTAAERLLAGPGCPLGRDTCPAEPGFDPVDNFMDSSADTCVTHFTNGQSARMVEKFEACRKPGQGPCLQG